MKQATPLLVAAAIAATPIWATSCPDTGAAIGKCYLQDLDSGVRTEVTPGFQYELEDDDRYSLTCDVSGSVDRGEFVFGGEKSDDWNLTDGFWMKNNEGDRIFDARYLTTCGVKEVDVSLWIWADSEAPCASKTLTFEAICEDTPAPTAAPIPEVDFCRRAAFYLEYRPAVPQGWTIEVRKVSDKDNRREIAVVDSEATRVHLGALRNKPNGIHAWFHRFRKSPFQMRFVNEVGMAGPWRKCNYNTPIALDIDHSGAVERISGEFKIDITGDGNIETLVEWFAPSEGILIDSTLAIENGVVTGHHLFGDLGGTYTDGYAKLMQHDSNSNGYVEGHELDGFAIWTDANSNAMVDEGELSTLASHEIVALSVVHDDAYASTALLKDGSTMYMEDLWFNAQRR